MFQLTTCTLYREKGISVKVRVSLWEEEGMKITDDENIGIEFEKHEKKYPIHKKFEPLSIYDSEEIDEGITRIFCKMHPWEIFIKTKPLKRIRK